MVAMGGYCFRYSYYYFLYFAHKDNEYNITFISGRPIITPALADFINYCTQLYGPDSNGASIITNEDIYDSQRYLFSRMWDDVSIHQDATGLSNELLTLTIFYEKKLM